MSGLCGFISKASILTAKFQISPFRLLYSSKFKDRLGGPNSRVAIIGFGVSEMLRDPKKKKTMRK